MRLSSCSFEFSFASVLNTTNNYIINYALCFEFHAMAIRVYFLINAENIPFIQVQDFMICIYSGKKHNCYDDDVLILLRKH